MNSLSWILYFAGVAGDLSRVLVMASVVGIIGGTICYIVGLTNKDTKPIVWSWEKAEDKIPAHKALFTALAHNGKRAVIGGFAAALAVAIIPSQDTVYAIAASEMGESALKSETGGKAVKALNAWLDRQIGDEPRKAAK